MAASSSSIRALILSLKPLHPPPLSRSLFSSLPTLSLRSRSSFLRSVICCYVPGGGGSGGGGVSETRKSEFSREFAVIANMLMRIEPLDSSGIVQGVSESAKESMKQTISTMLGILPSEQFGVEVRVDRGPMGRLLASSIITGYTLWNTEYRISLMRNFDLTFDHDEPLSTLERSEVKANSEVSAGQYSGLPVFDHVQGLEESKLNIHKGLSPEALNYVQQLEAELNSTKEELEAQKQEYRQMDSNRPNENDLLEYLRSLKTEMVSELARPSSMEVKEVIHQLAQSILQRFFKDVPSEAMEDREMGSIEHHQNGVSEDCETISTSRDYLAKLLFWCMLLGHHLRGLENRLHLSCVVGLL